MVNQWERAARAWPILTRTAASKATITYGALSARLGLPHHRPLRYVLGKIQDYCLDAKLPPLTILVVSQASGHPGAGFIAWEVDHWEEGLRQVHEYPWLERPNPFGFAADGSTPEQLAGQLFDRPEDAAEIYGRIRDRGSAQRIFRLALLKAYQGKCAFCGLSLREALEAAHIIPWSKASRAERVLPSNGLLLCSTHHALFDASVIRVSADLRIACEQSRLPRHHWNEADRRAALSLDGQPLARPADDRHRPSGAAFVRRVGLISA